MNSLLYVCVNVQFSYWTTVYLSGWLCHWPSQLLAVYSQMVAVSAFGPAKIGCQIWHWLVTRIPGYHTFSIPAIYQPEEESTLYCAPNMCCDKVALLQPTLVEEGVEQGWWLKVVLCGQLESAPVYPKWFLASNIFMNLHSFSRMDMLVLHEPVWLVGSWQHKQGNFQLEKWLHILNIL